MFQEKYIIVALKYMKKYAFRFVVIRTANDFFVLFYVC